MTNIKNIITVVLLISALISKAQVHLEFDTAKIFLGVKKIKHTAYPYGMEKPVKHLLLINNEGRVSHVSRKGYDYRLDYHENH